MCGILWYMSDDKDGVESYEFDWPVLSAYSECRAGEAFEEEGEGEENTI